MAESLTGLVRIIEHGMSDTLQWWWNVKYTHHFCQRNENIREKSTGILSVSKCGNPLLEKIQCSLIAGIQ